MPWVVSFGLVLNGTYQSYLGATTPSLSALAWAAVSFASAWGMARLRQWTRHWILFLAVFSVTAWVDETHQSYLRGWPDYSATELVVAFIPATFLILWWVCASYYAFRVLGKHGT